MLAQFRYSVAYAAFMIALGITTPVFASSSGIDTPTTNIPFSINGTEVMTLFNTGLNIDHGNLTAGTTSVGTLNAGTTTIGSATAAANMVVYGTQTATAYYHSSDFRLKSDIHPIHNALDKLLAIKGVQFKWKQDGRADMGVVAQNVAEVFPDVVSKNKDGMMSVEYDSLVGPMIESIRELKAENDALRQRIENLEATKAQHVSVATP